MRPELSRPCIVCSAAPLDVAPEYHVSVPSVLVYYLCILCSFDTAGRDQERMNTIVEKEYRQDEQDEQDGQDGRHTRMGDVDTETAVSADAVAEGFVGGDDSNSDATPLRSSPRRAEALSRSSTDVQRQPQQ